MGPMKSLEATGRRDAWRAVQPMDVSLDLVATRNGFQARDEAVVPHIRRRDGARASSVHVSTMRTTLAENPANEL